MASMDVMQMMVEQQKRKNRQDARQPELMQKE